MTVYDGALDPSPCCPACDSPFLAWQVAIRCVLWRCPRCGHIERDIRLAPARARSLDYGGDPAADRIRLTLTARRLMRRVELPASARVLEIGSGDGRLAERLAVGVREVVTVDTSDAPAPAAANVRHLTGRIEEVDLGKEPFDLVVGIHVLEHVTDLRRILVQVRSLLAHRGVAYFVTPNADCAYLRAFGEAWWMLEDPTHVRFLSARSAELIAERAGFARVRTRRLLLDSLASDGATLARRVRRAEPPGGVLEDTLGRVTAVGVLPATVALRSVRPAWRPAMEVVVS